MRALLPGDLDWPGAQQIFRLERTRVRLTTGELQRAITYGLTGLAPARGAPPTLLRHIRGHWPIENRSHYMRDVTFDADRSQVRFGATPQVPATIRTAMISLFRLTDSPHSASATRRCAAQPFMALALLGIPGK